MKKTVLYLFAFCLYGSVVSAQVSPSPATQEVGGSVDMLDIEAKFDLTNGTTEQPIRWAVEFGGDWPADWQAWVCDENLCYTPGIVQDPQGSVLDSRETENWSLHSNPQGIPGVGTLILHITDEVTGDTLTTVEVVYNVLTSSTGELVQQAVINLYPNPTVDFFQIDNDATVSSVQLFDIVGREVFNRNHTAGSQYDVSTLRNGMYLVRLMDDNGDLLKSTRLSKH
jgi:hypothetical protein